MSTPPPLPDPTTYPCLDTFLRTLPPLASNPTDERSTLLAHFQREIGSVSDKVLLDIANHVVKFGIFRAVARGSLVPQSSFSEQKDATTGQSGSEMGPRVDANPTRLRAATPALTASAPQPSSSQTPAQQQTNRATDLINTITVPAQARVSLPLPPSPTPEDDVSLPLENPDLHQLLQEMLQGTAVREDVADADPTMGAIIPQWTDLNFVPPTTLETMSAATGSDTVIGDNFSFEMGGMGMMPTRAETPAPVPESSSVLIAPRVRQPRPPAPGQGSGSTSLDTKAGGGPAYPKALVASQVLGPRSSLTPAPQQFSSMKARRPFIGSATGMRAGASLNLGPVTAPSMVKFDFIPTMVPYRDNLAAQAARTANTAMGTGMEMTSVYTRAGTPALLAPTPAMRPLPHLFETRATSATPSGDSPFSFFSDTDDSGTRTPDTPLITSKASAPAPLLPSADTTSGKGKPLGEPSTKKSKKRKATESAPAGTKEPKKKKAADTYCPYCKKSFVKTLTQHIRDNAQCNNDDLLAIYHHEGSLAPNDSPNLPKVKIPQTGSSSAQTAQGMPPSAPTSSLPAPKKSQSKPKKNESFMVLMSTMAPGAEPLPDGQSAYTHVPYGAPRF